MEKLKKLWKKVWNYIKYLWNNPFTTLPAFIIAETIFWIPVWVPFLLGIFINPWWFTISTAVIVFWAGPFTPTIILQIGFIAAIERLLTKIKNKNKEKNKNGRKRKQCRSH